MWSMFVLVLACSLLLMDHVNAGRHYRHSSLDSLWKGSSIDRSVDQSINQPHHATPTMMHYQQGPYTSIDNVNDRRDVYGQYMNIHDGKIIQVFDQSTNQSLFYYFGASYANCTEPPGTTGCANDCGFQLNHNVSLFTSTDLINWTPSINQPVMQVARDFSVPGVVMFCPKVLFNPRTNLWVMWFNYDLGGLGYLAVMTATSPDGPWVEVSTQQVMATTNEGDFNLFQDDNFDAYILYTGRGPTNNPMLMVEKLSFDYTTSLGAEYNSGNLQTYYCEAPAMTKLNGLYLISFGPDCCYCKGGSANTMYASTEPLGPYKSIGTFTSAIPAQQTDMLTFKDHRNETKILWLGDRWQQSPSGEKARDLTYMGILHFNDNGDVEQLAFEDTVEVHVLPNAPAIEPLPGANSGAVASSSFAPPSGYMGSSSSFVPPPPSLAVCQVDTAGSPLVNVTYELNPAVTSTQVWSFPVNEGGIAVIGSKFDPLSPSSPPFGAQSQYAFMVTSTQSTMTAQLTGVEEHLFYSASFWYALGACSKPKSKNSTVQVTLSDDSTGRILWKSPVDLPYVGGWTSVITPPFKLVASVSNLSFKMIVRDGSVEAVLINSATVAVTSISTSGVIPDYEYSFEFPVLPPGDGAWIYNPPISANQPWNFTAGAGGIAAVSSTWDPAPPITAPSCRQYAYIQNGGNMYSVMTAPLAGLKTGRNYRVEFYYGVRSSSQTLGDMSHSGITESQMSIFIDNDRIFLSQKNLTGSGGWMPARSSLFKASKADARLAFSVVNLDPTADNSILIDQVRVVGL